MEADQAYSESTALSMWNEAVTLVGTDRSETAIKLFEKLANGGWEGAAFALGCLYEADAESDSSKLDLAIMWFTKAVESEGDALAMVALARNYLSKDPNNIDRALVLLEKAAEADNIIALGNLGEMYERGYSVQESSNTAERYYRKAAGGGLVFAMARLGTICWKKGAYFPAIGWRIKAAYRAFLLSLTNSEDVRLWWLSQDKRPVSGRLNESKGPPISPPVSGE